MSSVIASYEVELSSLNLTDSQKEVVMRILSTFEKGGAKSISGKGVKGVDSEFGSTFSKGGGKGRPSKSKKVVEVGGDTDVFEQLLSMGLSEDPPLGKVSATQAAGSRWQEPKEDKILAPPLSKVESKKEKLAAANAKAAEKAAKAAEKQAAKDAKEAAKQAVIDAKLAKEAEKAAAIKAKEDAKQAKEAEKEAAKQAVIDAKLAKEAEKLAKEAEKAAAIKAKEDAKLAKEAEKEAKAAAKAEKEAKKAEKEAKKAEKEVSAAQEPKKKAVKKTVESAPSTEESPNAEVPVASAAAEESLKKVDAVRVKKFSFEGVKYLKDSAGTIYDLASQDRIGVWNEDEKKIVFDAKGEEDEEDECSEEEYE